MLTILLYMMLFVQYILHYDSRVVKFCSGVCFAMLAIFAVTSIHYILRG